MKRWLWGLVGAAVVGTAAVGLVALGRSPEFTTSSPQAMAELEAALDAKMKLYSDETREHLERAVALDPGFVLAKLLLVEPLYGPDKERGDKLLAEVAKADLERLTARERFLVRRGLALHSGQSEEADKLVDQYLADHPDDPWVLNIKAGQAWAAGDMVAAERLNHQLIEISPNWVIAYNMLGYAAMGQGRFADAEEAFISYRFIAPEQANPHDSLGELYVLLGRYDEAVATLEHALQIKPDFCASYGHLLLVHLLRRDWEAARVLLERETAVKGCTPAMTKGLDCVARLYRLTTERAWQELLTEAAAACPSEPDTGEDAVEFKHLALCQLGRYDEASAVEGALREAVAKWAAEPGHKENTTALTGALLLHLEGTRLALSGDLGQAEQRLRAADSAMTFMGAGPGLAKLMNQLVLVEVLTAQGKQEDADRQLAAVAAVNPAMAKDFEEHGGSSLGLELR